MSMAQEMLEDSVNQIKTNVEENAKEGVDTKMVVEAITAVGTLVESLLRLPPSCQNQNSRELKAAPAKL